MVKSNKKDKSIEKGQLHVFGIAINEYTSVPELKTTVRELDAFIDILKQQYGLDRNKIRRIINLAAKRSSIICILEEYAQTLAPSDSLIIYYAGHGYKQVETDPKDGYWVPVDGTAKELPSLISNVKIKELIEKIKCKHILLISDSCFSGSVVRSDKNSNSYTLAEELSQYSSRWAFYSGRYDQKVKDDSPFSQALIRALSENTKRLLRITELSDIVSRFLIEKKVDYQKSGAAGLMIDGHKEGEFVFSLKKEPQPLPSSVLKIGKIELTKTLLLTIGLFVIVLSSLATWFLKDVSRQEVSREIAYEQLFNFEKMTESAFVNSNSEYAGHWVYDDENPYELPLPYQDGANKIVYSPKTVSMYLWNTNNDSLRFQGIEYDTYIYYFISIKKNLKDYPKPQLEKLKIAESSSILINTINFKSKNDTVCERQMTRIGRYAPKFFSNFEPDKRKALNNFVTSKIKDFNNVKCEKSKISKTPADKKRFIFECSFNNQSYKKILKRALN